MEVPARKPRVALEHQTETRHHPIGAEVTPSLEGQLDFGVVLVVLADTIKGMDNPDPKSFELFDRTNAREHQNLGAMIHTGTEDNSVR